LKCVKIPKTPQGESKLYGFVEFQHECSVDYAIQLFHHTTLFGQELQLKRRKQNNPERVPISPFPGMHRTGSLPIMMNFPMQPHPLLFRPPFITGFMNPPTNMLNFGLGMSPTVPSMPSHTHFDDDGLPKTDSIPIPAIFHGQYNNSVVAPHHSTGIIIETINDLLCFPLEVIIFLFQLVQRKGIKIHQPHQIRRLTAIKEEIMITTMATTAGIHFSQRRRKQNIQIIQRSA